VLLNNRPGATRRMFAFVDWRAVEKRLSEGAPNVHKTAGRRALARFRGRERQADAPSLLCKVTRRRPVNDHFTQGDLR